MDRDRYLRAIAARTVVQQDGCIYWTKRIDSDGYGKFAYEGREIGSHRLSYIVSNGAIPDDMQIDHLCHGDDESCAGGSICMHRRCVNPDHLQAVPPGVNTLRGQSFSARNAVKTRCDSGHEFTSENTYVRPGTSHRDCRACIRTRAQQYKARKQASA